MKALRPLAVGALALLMAGCASDPVPDVSYFKLAVRGDLPARAEPLTALPISVDAFLADGVYNEQAILYVDKPGGGLRAYHYQLWEGPPTRLVQRRLIAELRARGMSALVSDRLPPSMPQVHISGLVHQFSRQRTAAGGWEVHVALELRVERDSMRQPLLVRRYEANEPARGDTMTESALAFSTAIDRVFERFVADLEQLKP